MLEQKIEALTAAVEALTAILTSQGGAAATTTAPAATVKTEEKAPAAADKPKRTTTTKATAVADKPKHTKAEVQAAVNEVKENFDVATAKALIKEAGFDKLGDVTEDKFDELYEAAKAKMAELEGDGDEGGDDGL